MNKKIEALASSLNPRERERLQYYSKLYNGWKDVKGSDDVLHLIKYKYKIRLNPVYDRDVF